jgi:protein-S-isoprenylcysteine O-methyltransferase Ste14
MIVTDTLDSVIVHRLISFRTARLPRIMRVWIVSVTILALAVAVYELAPTCGWHPPFSDLQASTVLVIALGAVFAYIFVATHPLRARSDGPPAAAITMGEGQ